MPWCCVKCKLFWRDNIFNLLVIYILVRTSIPSSHGTKARFQLPISHIVTFDASQPYLRLSGENPHKHTYTHTTCTYSFAFFIYRTKFNFTYYLFLVRGLAFGKIIKEKYTQIIICFCHTYFTYLTFISIIYQAVLYSWKNSFPTKIFLWLAQ